MPSPAFATRVIRWQRRHGRHGLPWQATRDAYRIWLSEVMLQQTQVATVVPYYERFLARFPTVRELARANEDEVLALWSGLGYYARGRNLLAAARRVEERHGGTFPERFDDLVELPGVGRSTAGAIAALAAGERRAILDGNARRVLARHAGIDGDSRLWEVAEARLPSRDMPTYTQGMMDLGAQVCTARRPACSTCPVASDCVARSEERVDEWPARRGRAAVRRRRVAMLVAISRGEVLVEKRPPSGIWGGLWSLPEAPVEADPVRELAREWGLAAGRAESLPPFEHSFTHFTLEVTPWLLRPRGQSTRAGERAAIWLPLSDLAGAALPSPVRKLLLALRDDATTAERPQALTPASASPGTDAARPGAARRR